MKPIILYQIPFSHFCDKVRWSLDFYSIPYEAINYVRGRTPGLEKAPPALQKLTPIIEDPNNESLFISDSTPVMLYLDQHYGFDKTLFPRNMSVDKDVIVEYCLKLDSQLGLYSRRLVYLYIISKNPAMLSVLVDGNYNKVSCDDWKSYILGLFGCCIIIGRLGIHQIKEEHIFEKTVCLLEEIKKDIEGKEYLFNNQFTAADLTLTSLIGPLRLVPPIYTKYKSIFDHCDRIRKQHDPKPEPLSNTQRLYASASQKTPSTLRNICWFICFILFYPLKFVFNADSKKPPLQYPSTNVVEKANNDVRILNLDSMFSTPVFLIKHLWHFFFTLPTQKEFVDNEGKKLLQGHS